jgi:hypothetical protein
VLLPLLKATRHHRDRMRGTRHLYIQSQKQIWQSSCLNNTQILHEHPLKLHTTNKSSKYLCITKTLWNTQTTREYTNKQKQEAPTLPSTLEESTPPLEAAREQHVPSQESPQQRNNHLQPPITTNHDLTRWRDPHARILFYY